MGNAARNPAAVWAYQGLLSSGVLADGARVRRRLQKGPGMSIAGPRRRHSICRRSLLALPLLLAHYLRPHLRTEQPDSKEHPCELHQTPLD